jgi:hypothetical protein
VASPAWRSAASARTDRVGSSVVFSIPFGAGDRSLIGSRFACTPGSEGVANGACVLATGARESSSSSNGNRGASRQIVQVSGAELQPTRLSTRCLATCLRPSDPTDSSGPAGVPCLPGAGPTDPADAPSAGVPPCPPLRSGQEIPGDERGPRTPGAPEQASGPPSRKPARFLLPTACYRTPPGRQKDMSHPRLVFLLPTRELVKRESTKCGVYRVVGIQALE